MPQPNTAPLPAPYSEEMVLRVNELYYDITHQIYGLIHNEMGSNERERWVQIAERFLDFPQPATIADVGTGNGFVPLTIAPLLRPHDTLLCSDISSGMLQAARRTLEAAAVPPTLGFVKIASTAPLRLPFESSMLDAVAMNSVLHHIRNTAEFLAEIDRILKPGGLLLIGHEPNGLFRQHPFLWRNYRLLSSVIHPTIGATTLSRKLRLYAPMMKLYYRLFPKKGERSRRMMQQINQALIEEGISSNPIKLEELAEITDIRDMEGFVPDQLLPNYQLLHLESYDYLRVINRHRPNNRLIRWYDQHLAKRYPTSGGTFFVVLRKPAE